MDKAKLIEWRLEIAGFVSAGIAAVAWWFLENFFRSIRRRRRICGD
ncbi:hypothetical protein [Aureibacter tunicatorum]|uniref:Uncharacterized protein n=1 Tax=Aureibacter tunicatorum TaxID=866807 RepID=A0AAE4BV59_9BACT|nr:hypothetical protein [Aureibacter tunicatorum]MDR6241750.1 hypothetical protein [Aureibacter tunicatorum]